MNDKLSTISRLHSKILTEKETALKKLADEIGKVSHDFSDASKISTTKVDVRPLLKNGGVSEDAWTKTGRGLQRSDADTVEWFADLLNKKAKIKVKAAAMKMKLQLKKKMLNS